MEPGIAGQADGLAGWREQLTELRGNLVVRDEKSETIVETYQMTVEQPVGRRREGDAVLDLVGAALGDRPDVRRLRLGLPAAVDDAQPSHGTSVVVGVEYEASERGVADPAIDEHLLAAPL